MQDPAPWQPTGTGPPEAPRDDRQQQRRSSSSSSASVPVCQEAAVEGVAPVPASQDDFAWVGNIPSCSHCGDRGHSSTSCTTPFCSTCNKHGHMQDCCSSACSECGKPHKPGQKGCIRCGNLAVAPCAAARVLIASCAPAFSVAADPMTLCCTVCCRSVLQASLHL